MKLKPLNHWKSEDGKIGWVLLWLVGIPLPLLAILYLIFGK